MTFKEWYKTAFDYKGHEQGYSQSFNGAKRAWEHQQKRITELEAGIKEYLDWDCTEDPVADHFRDVLDGNTE
jgi:hypothetical protein